MSKDTVQQYLWLTESGRITNTVLREEQGRKSSLQLCSVCLECRPARMQPSSPCCLPPGASQTRRMPQAAHRFTGKPAPFRIKMSRTKQHCSRLSPANPSLLSYPTACAAHHFLDFILCHMLPSMLCVPHVAQPSTQRLNIQHDQCLF